MTNSPEQTNPEISTSVRNSEEEAARQRIIEICFTEHDSETAEGKELIDELSQLSIKYPEVYWTVAYSMCVGLIEEPAKKD